MSDSHRLQSSFSSTMGENFTHDSALSLAIWHLKRCSYKQAKIIFSQLATVAIEKEESISIALAVCICCAMFGGVDLDEGRNALQIAINLLENLHDHRVLFCQGSFLSRFIYYLHA